MNVRKVDVECGKSWECKTNQNRSDRLHSICKSELMANTIKCPTDDYSANGVALCSQLMFFF